MKDTTDTPTTFQYNGLHPFPWTHGRRPENISGIPNFFSKPVFGKTSDILTAARFLVVAAVVSSILRIFSKRRTKSKFQLDDVCAVAATVFLIADTMILIEFNYLGRISFSFFGESEPADEKERRANIVLGLKLSLAYEVLYLTGMFLVKFSMLFLYDRVARQTRGITLYLRVTQCLCAASLVACILALFLSCRPVTNFWSLTQNDAAGHS
ncbi:hypothetical protein K440DRAFT_415803 [Wilcoxina mikolae CBS 423.85]|nr:hypothetical protein K440DRAFT_415803 [Wilcoxina mikolae CBS 423.85]